jgi:LAO/AO transport system kinase
MKAGLMEIADIFVVNKSDRPDAQNFVRHLRSMLAPAFYAKKTEIPIMQTVAMRREGVDALWEKILAYLDSGSYNNQKVRLLAEKVYYLIMQERMKGVSKEVIKETIEQQMNRTDFNVYRFTKEYTDSLK